jgi:hypothetical protein
MSNPAINQTPAEAHNYRGFLIVRNDCGSYNVSAINCFSTPSLKTAKAAIDRALYERATAHYARVQVAIQTLQNLPEVK